MLPWPIIARDSTRALSEVPSPMDDVAALTALAHRLERLERGIRRWRLLGGIAWGGLALGVALNLALIARVPGTLGPDDEPDTDESVAEEEIRARAFVLVDDEGRPRGALGLRADGTPALAFSDAQGKIIWKAP
jgi:hypothetical protein